MLSLLPAHKCLDSPLREGKHKWINLKKGTTGNNQTRVITQPETGPPQEIAASPKAAPRHASHKGKEKWEYRHECRGRAIAGNTIINLPTGFGKTLIAVHVFKHFARTGQVLLAVPTLELVTQQEAYIKKHGGDELGTTHGLHGGDAKLWGNEGSKAVEWRGQG